MPNVPASHAINGRVSVYFRRQAREKLAAFEAKTDTDTPAIGRGSLIKLLKDITLISYYPWVGRQIDGLSERYRFLLSGQTYITYYINMRDDETEDHVLLLDLRTSSQKSPKSM